MAQMVTPVVCQLEGGRFGPGLNRYFYCNIEAQNIKDSSGHRFETKLLGGGLGDTKRENFEILFSKKNEDSAWGVFFG